VRQSSAMEARDDLSRKKFPPMTGPREYRLRRGVTLAEAAVFSRLSMFRASVIERDPTVARPGELERLRRGVDRAAMEQLAETGQAR
jgi:hypothetical protein